MGGFVFCALLVEGSLVYLSAREYKPLKRPLRRFEKMLLSKAELLKRRLFPKRRGKGKKPRK